MLRRERILKDGRRRCELAQGVERRREFVVSHLITFAGFHNLLDVVQRFHQLRPFLSLAINRNGDGRQESDHPYQYSASVACNQTSDGDATARVPRPSLTCERHVSANDRGNTRQTSKTQRENSEHKAGGRQSRRRILPRARQTRNGWRRDAQTGHLRHRYPSGCTIPPCEILLGDLAGAESGTQFIKRKWTELLTTAIDENTHHWARTYERDRYSCPAPRTGSIREPTAWHSTASAESTCSGRDTPHSPRSICKVGV